MAPLSAVSTRPHGKYPAPAPRRPGRAPTGGSGGPNTLWLEKCIEGKFWGGPKHPTRSKDRDGGLGPTQD